MSKSEIFKCVCIAVVLYAAVSSIVFRFYNPCLTETELFLRLWDAITWSSHRWCK